MKAAAGFGLRGDSGFGSGVDGATGRSKAARTREVWASPQDLAVTGRAEARARGREDGGWG